MEDHRRSDAENEIEPIVKAEHMRFEYTEYDDEGKEGEHVVAIYDLSLKVKPGQFIGVLGHNGSGKSTLAKHLNALLIPTGGTVWIGGYDTKDSERLWDIRQTAGKIGRAHV